ncbi:MAG: hypothetical protein GY775_19280 [Candidatus Scalindua sp.]|nr:hypothetical protein [Candidatus Scalindua sp.]
METTQHSYIKGMNRDIAKDKFPKDSYSYLLNGRVLSDDDSTLSNIINVKGNTTANINDNGLNRTSYSIIGYVTLQEDIILFYAANTATGVDSFTTVSIIDKLTYSGDNLYDRSQLWFGLGLNFRIDKPIKAVSRYESNLVQKIYWTDENNPLKQANIATSISGNDAAEFDISGTMENSIAPSFNAYTSGSLKQGSICYAYRFKKKNGYKTIFSDTSEMIVLGSNIGLWKAWEKVYGDAVYDPDTTFNTGKGVILNLSVTDVDLRNYYDYLEVISLWYSSDIAVPDINIISKLPMDSSTTYYRIVDTGTNSFGSLTYEEFLDQSKNFVTGSIETKDNRLFAANIKEQYFDVDSDATWTGKSPGDLWDGRSYRFDSTRKCELLSDPVGAPEYTLNGAAPSYSSVVNTANAINTFNSYGISDAGQQNTTGGLQQFQADGITYGGSGPNITYEFVNESFYLISTPDNSPSLNGLIQPTPIRDQLGMKKGFQRREVYRFGIVFFDNKGRQSFVKWVGDIRFPDISVGSSNPTTYNGTTDEITARNLYPKFTLSNIPSINGNPLMWQIVYVKREESDKGVVAAGMLHTTQFRDHPETRPSPVPGNIGAYSDSASATTYDINKHIVNFISPEINFREDESIRFDYLEIAGELRCDGALAKDRTTDSNTWTVKACPDPPDGGFHRNLIKKYLTVLDSGYNDRMEVREYIKSIPPTSLDFVTPIDNDIYKHFSYYDDGSNTGAPHGSCLTLKLQDPISSATGNINYYYGYLRKDVYQSQYGGFTYGARQNNTFIIASNKELGSTTTTICRSGDIYNTVFEYGAFFMQQDGFPGIAKSYSEFEYIGCESSINCLLRTKDTYSRTYTIDSTIPGYINENPYTDTNTGITLDGIYGYNSGYNKLDDSKKFFIEPILFTQIEEFASRVKYSDLKIENEDTDSWLSFRSNNYNDANENYGSINRIINFQDKIFSFQDSGVSLVSINPRVTQQSQDGVAIILGTGEVIDKFHYLSTDIGCQEDSDIIKSFSSMYWLDKNKKKIYSYNGKIESITDLKGLHTYLKNNIYEDSQFKGVYDVSNSEVLFTIKDSTPNTIFQADDLGGGDWNLLGDTSIIDIPFIKDRLYKIEDGYFIYVSKTNASYKFTYSHGTDFVASQDVDLQSYIVERDNFTIGYSEKLQAFQSFYSFLPDLYVYHIRDYFTSINNRDLWQHNIGTDFNTFYNVTYPTSLKLITNFGGHIQSEYTNLSFFCEMQNELGELQSNETITNIKVKDTTQISEDIILYPISLPEDALQNRNVLDTSALKIGNDWYSGLISNSEDLKIYNNELYRCITDLQAGPPSIGTNWGLAELGNIRKTNNQWHTQIPRFSFDENGLGDPDYIQSNRFRSNWMEVTLEFKDTLPGISIADRRMKLSDIKLLSHPMMF